MKALLIHCEDCGEYHESGQCRPTAKMWLGLLRRFSEAVILILAAPVFLTVVVMLYLDWLFLFLQRLGLDEDLAGGATIISFFVILGLCVATLVVSFGPFHLGWRVKEYVLTGRFWGRIDDISYRLGWKK